MPNDLEEEDTDLPDDPDAGLPYDSGDPAQVNEERRKAGRRDKKRLVVVKALLQHKDGRQWVYEMLESCHILGNPVELDATQRVDTHLTMFHLGEQNIGKRLLIDVEEASPESYILMRQEAREREMKEKRRKLD
jgi:hypothetical protein